MDQILILPLSKMLDAWKKMSYLMEVLQGWF